MSIYTFKANWTKMVRLRISLKKENQKKPRNKFFSHLVCDGLVVFCLLLRGMQRDLHHLMEFLHDTLPQTFWHAHFNRSWLAILGCSVWPLCQWWFSVQFLRTDIGPYPFYSHLDQRANRDGAKKNSLCAFVGYCSFPKSEVIQPLPITWLHCYLGDLLCGQGLFFFHLFILFFVMKSFLLFLSFSALVFISFCERTLSKRQKVDAGGDFAEEMRGEKGVREPLPGRKQNQHQCGHIVKLHKNVKIRKGGVVPPKR